MLHRLAIRICSDPFKLPTSRQQDDNKWHDCHVVYEPIRVPVDICWSPSIYQADQLLSADGTPFDLPFITETTCACLHQTDQYVERCNLSDPDTTSIQYRVHALNTQIARYESLLAIDSPRLGCYQCTDCSSGMCEMWDNEIRLKLQDKLAKAKASLASLADANSDIFD